MPRLLGGGDRVRAGEQLCDLLANQVILLVQSVSERTARVSIRRVKCTAVASLMFSVRGGGPFPV